MFPLFESIRCYNGRIYNIAAHEARMNRSRKAHYEGVQDIKLRRRIKVPAEAQQGLYKCRIAYGREVGEPIFTPYSPRTIKSLQLVDGDRLEYGHKWEDRSGLDGLVAQRGQADDVLIVQNGLITDSSYANVALWDGQAWITPSKPLLPGTMRARLLRLGRLREGEVRTEDLGQYKKICLINALNPLRQIVVDIKQIHGR